MGNYVLLKWGSLKGYNFTDKFIKEHKEVVEELANVWDRIYERHCSATGGSDEVQKNNQLKLDMLNVIEKIYNLGVTIQNNWDNTIYDNFNDIKEYILNYGKGE
jgi:hypothetical protein